MTRKDYTLIAKVIKEAVDENEELHLIAYRHVIVKFAHKMADELARENSRFSRFMFLQACGLTEGEINGPI